MRQTEGDVPDSNPPAVTDDRTRRRVLEGPLRWGVLRFGGPLALAMAFQVLFNLVDQFLISRLPPAVANPSLDALGICDMVAALATIVSYGVSTATVTIVSQHAGQKDMAGAARVAWASVGLVLALGAFFAVLALTCSDVIVHHVIGAKGAVRLLAKSYLEVIVGGSVTIFLLFQLTAIQRALGHSRAPLAVIVLGNVVNFGLAVVMVYGPGPAPAVFSWGPPIAHALHIPRMEVVGAAWATIIARALACVPPAVLVARELRVPKLRAALVPDRATAGRIVHLAWPSSAQFVVRACAVLGVASLVHHYYTTLQNSDTGTAYALCLRLETMALFVSMGWGSAAQTFVGMNLGAGATDRATRSGWSAGFYNMATMAVLAVLYVTVGEKILGVFTERPEILAIGNRYLETVGPSYVLFGLAVVLANAMTGAGATRLTLAIDGILVAGVQLPLMIMVVAGFHARSEALWYAVAGINTLSAVVYVVVYRIGALWQKSHGPGSPAALPAPG